MKTFLHTLGLLGLTTLLSGSTPADEKKESPRVAVAKLVSADGSVLRREASEKPWVAVKKGEELFTNDHLVGLPGAVLESSNGALRLTFKTDLARKSPLPILESAIMLRKKDGLDLYFYLDRGRVEVTSQTDKAAKFTFGWDGKNPCLFEMDKKDSTVLVETYSRWAPGAVFDPKGKSDQKPLTDLVFLVTRGEVLACTGEADLALRAPPGPALFTANDSGVSDKGPRFLEKLPDWLVVDEKAPEVVAARGRLEEFRKLIVEKGPTAAIDTFVESDDLLKKRLAIIAMCATDDIGRLRKTFYTSKSPEVLDLCIQMLRHWLGRDASHDMILYKAMIADPNIPPAQATTALQLLHTFDEKHLAQVETYEALVGYLRHKALGVRALAHYQLVRLYPDGREFEYNPAGGDEERAAAVAKWREVLAAGKLPPKPNK